MREIDWDEVETILKDLILYVDDACTQLCIKKFLKGCNVIDKKVIPILEDLLEEARRAGKASSGLMAGLFGGEEKNKTQGIV